MVADPALVVAVDRVDHGQDAEWLGNDAGLLDEFTHRPLGDCLAQFQNTAGKAPAPGQRRIRPAHDESALVAQHHRQHPDDWPIRVAATLLAPCQTLSRSRGQD